MAIPPPPTASLYVGDLHHDVTDGQLFDAFSEFESLVSVRVCHDLTTGRSLCYGYVNFISPHDVVRAIEMKNHSTLNGKVIRVSWARRDSDVRISGTGNVFIKNLNDTIDSAKLQEMFQKFGNISSCKVVVSEDGRSKGYGFVQFETEESANAAIEKLNGSVVGGKQMYVGKFAKKSDRILPNPDEKYTNLFIKNLDLDISEEHLREKCSEFGKVSSLAIAKDENGVSKGFGHVNFENPDDARRAMEAMNGSKLGCKILYVARAQKKTQREQILRHLFEERRKARIIKYQGSNVYVKNIDGDVTDNELRELFSQCGNITSAKLMLDEKGVSKGFGFVCFSTPEEANKAVNSFHGFMFGQKPLYVAVAQRKEERQAQLQLKHAQGIAGLTGSSAFLPGGYPPLYYQTLHDLQVPARPRLLYQPLSMRRGWMVNGFTNSIRPACQISLIPNTSQYRQSRETKNGHMPVPYVPHLQQSTQSVASLKQSSNAQQAWQVKYTPNGRLRDMKKGFVVSSSGTSKVGSCSWGSENLSNTLAAAPPTKQKQILGEHLYPLVSQHKPNLAAKVTGMLLEMDNSELLSLLKSPASLAAMVEEAVKVVELSKTEVSNQDSIQKLHSI
ncbi:polyadenylate-binding protein 7-like [Nicotiana tabacum]|uniref:Polyadenylate-binding protein n=1 Tax=Nicotiana tabacum TaxID=4097 RepID=A0A1S3ZW44_TOBAC|nr:PREDICTED: polyadenylate-binding protein 7-like [Nicotiana tabacum]